MPSSRLILLLGPLLLLAVGECAQYMGCYRDPSVQARLLSDLKTNLHSTLTIEGCSELCREKGFRYAGVEWKFECFCSEDRPSFQMRADEEECNLPCDGDRGQICGGNLRINVYDLRDGEGGDAASLRNHSLGCFKDPAGARLLKGYQTEASWMSPEFCVGLCYRKGFRLSALQSASCFCGDAALRPGLKSSSSECAEACPGENSKHCGGAERSNVYLTGIPDSPLNEEAFLGCYVEDRNGNRLLSGMKVVLKQTNSPRRCMNICLASGYKFSGTEFSNECFCGNRKPPSEKEAEENQCQMPCPGNKKEFCGGVWKILVHPTGSVTPVFPETQKKPGGGSTRPPPSPGKPPAHSKPPRPPTVTPTQPDQSSELESVRPSQPTKPAKNCPQLSATTFNGGRTACRGQLIFREDFQGDTLDSRKWAHRIYMPWTPDYDFVVLSDKPANSYLKNGKLVIKPTLLDDHFVKTGKMELHNCTGEQYTAECERQAATYSILPPIESARIYSKEFFAFKYGVVQVRAKLPVGDWIVPELWLEPKRRIYGLAYSSGRVRMAMARGNRRLTIDGVDIGNDNLESGILMGVGLDEGIRGRIVNRHRADGWHAQFHNFTLIWTPNNMKFQVDGLDELDLIPTEGGVLCDLVGFSAEDCQKWKTGSSMAPFDNELYLAFGLTVGGMRDFPDESLSGPDKKPWMNLNVKAMVNFWRARDKWKPTWDDDNSVLQVDHVRVYAV